MANPFLFDCPPAGGAQEVNPFLMGGTPAQVPPANPFLAENNVQSQQPPMYLGGGVAANPFMTENSFAPQPVSQQFYGQYGQYTQVTASKDTKANLSTASPPHTTPPPLIGTAAFGVLQNEKVEPVNPIEKELSKEQAVIEKSIQENVDSKSPSPPPLAIEKKESPKIEVDEALKEDKKEIIKMEEAEIIKVEETEAIKVEEKEVLKIEEKLSNIKVKEETPDKSQESEEKTPPTGGFSGIFTPIEKESDTQDLPIKESIGASLFGTSTEATETKLDLTKAAYEDDEEVKDVNEVLTAKPPSDIVRETVTASKMSTGDAIFSDLPSKPDLSSTGASIFGVSEEAAVNSTGATLFGVQAPKEAAPQLGQMTGWDDAFDRKFEVADSESVAKPGDPFDPFLSSAGAIPTYDPFGVGEEKLAVIQGFGGDDGFSTATHISAVKIPEDSNPFIENTSENMENLPLFDDDTSQPLEPFPRLNYDGDGWEMFIRHPPKKKLTSQRFWKKCFIRLVMQGTNPCVMVYENKESKDPFQELPLQASYSLSDIAHQVYDQYSKIFTIKLQYIFYKERAGIRPGQMTKMQKLTGKIGFLAKAVEDADYEGVKEFASDMKKLGVPLEHAPQISEVLKIGSHNYEELKQFTVCVEEKLFKMDIHRDRSLTYKTEEVQLTAVDEVYVEQDKSGKVLKQLARVRVFFCSFLTGMPDVELGVNDLARMGNEVVGRHDILPVPTEEWIRYEDIQFHSIIDKKEFEKNDHIIKFQPPDACYLELMRFRVRPPRARELPMQARCCFQITGNKVEIRADMMIPYHHTKAWGQVPCEDVAMRIPLPECWIYQFRTEKHHLSLTQIASGNLNLSTRMGSVKSAHRRAGKVKGIERFLGTLESQGHELMETSSGQAKYEHQHKAIVWRVPRLPKQGQGSYTNHEFVCKLQLTSFDQVPETFEKNFYVEFTQPATCVSHTVLRSVSILNGSGEPPEKFAKYLARHEYKLEIEFTEKEQNTYLQAARKKPVSEPDPPAHDPDAYVGQPEFPDEEDRKMKESSDSDSE